MIRLDKCAYKYKGVLRTVPVKIYYPDNLKQRKCPLILMSHGLGGSREASAFLGDFWAMHGFVVVAMQHAGSDEKILQGKGVLGKMRGLKEGMSSENLLKRLHDVSAIIDQIEEWNEAEGHFLNGRIDLEQVGMAGHSLGAMTTQLVSGEEDARWGQKYTDKRIKAALAMSPMIPRDGGKLDFEQAKTAFQKVRIPWLLMTGTKDKVSLAPQVTVESRLAVYQHLPTGDKYQLVLNGGTHSVFSGSS